MWGGLCSRGKRAQEVAFYCGRACEDLKREKNLSVRGEKKTADKCQVNAIREQRLFPLAHA